MTSHRPIAIAGLTRGSEDRRLAGEKGRMPVSLGIHVDTSVTAQPWEAVVEGAARSGRTPDRNEWRIIRDVYAAPTDEEAVERDHPVANLWFVGPPQTVADRVNDLQARTGGFGHLTMVSYDATDERESWGRSPQLLMSEVLPLCRGSEIRADKVAVKG